MINRPITENELLLLEKYFRALPPGPIDERLEGRDTTRLEVLRALAETRRLLEDEQQTRQALLSSLPGEVREKIVRERDLHLADLATFVLKHR